MNVKIIGVSGSLRKGNTDILVNECLRAAQELKDVETEFIRLIDYKIDGGCLACLECFKVEDPLDKMCQGYKHDDMNKILRKMLTGDGFIFGSPVYWASVTWKMREFIERCHPLSAAKILRNRPFGAVTCALGRNAGQHYVIDSIMKAFMMADMIPIGTSVLWPMEGCSSPWGAEGTQGFPESIGSIYRESRTAVKQDLAAMAAARNLGIRVAEMAKVIKAGFTVCNPENGETMFPYGPPTEAQLAKSGDIHFSYRGK